MIQVLLRVLLMCAVCSLPRRLPLQPRRSPHPLLRPHLPQPQTPHRLPRSHRASGGPVGAPPADAAVGPEPAAVPAACGEGVSSERQVAQRLAVRRARKRRRGRAPAGQGEEAEARHCRRRGAKRCQAAKEQPPKKHQWLAAGRPTLSQKGFLSGTCWSCVSPRR